MVSLTKKKARGENKMIVEIYWQDLTKEKQAELLAVLGENGNYDVFPIATIEIEEEETMAQAMN